jgi:hypothetical protein
MEIFFTPHFGQQGDTLKALNADAEINPQDVPEWAKNCFDAILALKSKTLIAHTRFGKQQIDVFITNKCGESRDILTIYAAVSVFPDNTLDKSEWQDAILQQLEAEKSRYNTTAREAHQRYVDATRHAGAMTWSV